MGVSKTTQVLGNIAAASARRRGATLAITAVAMLLLGGGITQLEFRDDPQQAMPKGHPNTLASQALIDTFPGASYTGALFVEVNPDKWDEYNARLPNRMPINDQSDDGQNQAQGAVNEAVNQGSGGQQSGTADGFPGPHNITDEVYMRAMEELWLFLEEEIPELKWGITLPSQVKLVNYTNTGVPNPDPNGDPIQFPDPEAFSMPGTDPQGSQQFSSAWQSYYAASLDSIKSITSGDWRVTRFGLLFEPGDKSLNEIGQLLYDGVDAYKQQIEICDAGGADCRLQWNVFTTDSITVDPRAPNTAASYLTKTTLEDVLTLVPYVAIFVLVSLFLAFRRIDTIAAMMLPMGLAGIGVLGIFGFIDLAIHSTSLLVFPILMGNGIDFAIHMSTGYGNAKHRGKDAIEAARAAGQSAGTPLFVATLTTLVGMGLLVFSPNRLLTELGLAIILGMVLLLLISVTALPAALSWTKPAKLKEGALGRTLMANARFWHKGRFAAGLIVLLAMMGGLLASPALSTFVIGTPAAQFPEDDPQRQDFEHSNDIYYVDQEDLVSNSLVLQGDLTKPANMALLGTLEDRLGDLDYVRDESAVSIRFALVSWIQVRGGTAGAPAVIAQESAEEDSTFPETQEEIKALMDEMFSTPLATYATFFANHPDYQIGNMLVEVYQPDSFAELEEIWVDLEEELDAIKAEHPDADLDMHLAGGTALGYLFTAEEFPYVQQAALLGIGITGLLVLAIRRNIRDALTVAVVVGASGVIWLAALYALGIQLSVALLVPVVMIAAIGSDYALHLRYGMREDGLSCWDSIGRAVFYSALTDVGAFLIFTRMRYGLLAEATLATAAALGVTVLVTMLVVPALSSKQDMELHNA